MPNRSVLVLQLAALFALGLALFMDRKERVGTAIRIWQGLFFASLVLGLIGSLDIGGVLTLVVNILSFVLAVVALVAVVVAVKQRLR